MCGEWGFFKGNCLAQFSGAADVWQGQLSRIPLKMLLYDDLVGVVNSCHVTKMVVTLLNPPNWCRWCWNKFSGPLLTVLACMLPDLHAVKVLFYAESVGLVTWQRWPSHHSTLHCRKPPAICKLHGSVFDRTRVIAKVCMWGEVSNVNHPDEVWCQSVHWFSIRSLGGLKIRVFHWQGETPLQQFCTTMQTVT